MPEETSLFPSSHRTPWNKGKLIGAKPPSSSRQSLRNELQSSRLLVHSWTDSHV
jgi:hypothetical protein